MKLSSYYFNEPLGLKELQQKSMEFSSKIAPFLTQNFQPILILFEWRFHGRDTHELKKIVINISKLETPLK